MYGTKNAFDPFFHANGIGLRIGFDCNVVSFCILRNVLPFYRKFLPEIVSFGWVLKYQYHSKEYTLIRTIERTYADSYSLNKSITSTSRQISDVI